jgi:SAM-dependent methyltransferase
MRQGWEDEARNWASFARTPGFDRAHERINRPALLDFLPPPGRLTLDLACGEGRLSRDLKSAGHHVAGIDSSPTMVTLAASHDAAATAVLGDAGRLPFRNEAFDLVVAYMCLHDIDEMPRAVTEAARVLEQGGRLCAAIPHPVNTAGTFAAGAQDAPFVIAGSYAEPAPLRFVAERDDLHLTFHSEHRPLGAYFGALEAAGLLTEAIREVTAGPDTADGAPGWRRWQRIPLFLHLRAVKPR